MALDRYIVVELLVGFDERDTQWNMYNFVDFEKAESFANRLRDYGCSLGRTEVTLVDTQDPRAFDSKQDALETIAESEAEEEYSQKSIDGFSEEEAEKAAGAVYTDVMKEAE